MPWRVILVGGVIVVAFDALVAVAAEAFNFDYVLAGWGSFVIYGVVGYVAGRQSGTVRAAAIAGAAVSLVEATLGWAVSWAIGPGGIEDPTVVLVAASIVFVVLLGALIGAFVGWLYRRRSKTSPRLTSL